MNVQRILNSLKKQMSLLSKSEFLIGKHKFRFITEQKHSYYKTVIYQNLIIVDMGSDVFVFLFAENGILELVEYNRIEDEFFYADRLISFLIFLEKGKKIEDFVAFATKYDTNYTVTMLLAIESLVSLEEELIRINRKDYCSFLDILGDVLIRDIFAGFSKEIVKDTFLMELKNFLLSKEF